MGSCLPEDSIPCLSTEQKPLQGRAGNLGHTVQCVSLTVRYLTYSSVSFLQLKMKYESVHGTVDGKMEQITIFDI